MPAESDRDTPIAADAAAELARALIERPSITPADAGCQPLIAARLQQSGFHIEHMRFGEVDNLWARHGSNAPLLCFAGHTDVVPPGPLQHWRTDPFRPELRGGLLYGRGAADMKGALAAMVTASELFAARYPRHAGSLALLLTSDEEGPAKDGTRRVVDTLMERGERIDWCLLGEPSSELRLGDRIRIGRRGSLNGTLRVQGRAGHVAYPELADNPIHAFAPALAELCQRRWDEGDERFPATSLQISNLQAGEGTVNVIPPLLEVGFNFRYSAATDADSLQQHMTALLRRHGLAHTLEWDLSGEPFLTGDGPLVDAVRHAVEEITGLEPRLSTGGGTSDGRFIAPAGASVIELGAVGESIHKPNERMPIADIDTLQALYLRIAELLLALNPAPDAGC